MYKKAILTIIAVCLISITFKETPLVEKALADFKGYTMVDYSGGDVAAQFDLNR